jgi:hypothetical protein
MSIIDALTMRTAPAAADASIVMIQQAVRDDS